MLKIENMAFSKALTLVYETCRANYGQHTIQHVLEIGDWRLENGEWRLDNSYKSLTYNY